MAANSIIELSSNFWINANSIMMLRMRHPNLWLVVLANNHEIIINDSEATELKKALGL